MPTKRNAAPSAATTEDHAAGLPEVSASGPCDYRKIPPPGSSFLKEQGIEDACIEKLIGLKYGYRPEILDRAALEANFREKFEAKGVASTPNKAEIALAA
jgi:hypothetical protein